MDLMALVSSVLSAALSRLFADEVKEWSPWIVSRVTEVALKLLPPNRRDRYREEWASHVTEVPGNLGKLVVALGFCSAAVRMAGWRSLLAIAQSGAEDAQPSISRWRWWFVLYPTVRNSPSTHTGIIPAVFATKMHQVRYGPKWQWTARLGFYSAVVLFLVLAGLTVNLMMLTDRPLNSYVRDIAGLVQYVGIALIWRSVIHMWEGPLPGEKP